MIKFMVILWIIYKVSRFLLVKKSYGKTKKGKSIAGKIVYLINNNMHDRLDHKIKTQIEKRKVEQSPNVIPIKKYKKA